jgi:uncharacterized short protein YbdD (DUF466 family)
MSSLTRSGRQEKKIAADVALKKAYDKYFKEMRAKNKQPMTYYHWKKGGRRSTYLGPGKTLGTARLSRSERKRVGHKD